MARYYSLNLHAGRGLRRGRSFPLGSGVLSRRLCRHGITDDPKCRRPIKRRRFSPLAEPRSGCHARLAVPEAFTMQFG